MAAKFISILATLAVVHAGYIESPVYSDEHHHGYLAPATKVAYSSAPAVSHVYSTLSSPNYAPVQKTLTYAPATVQKTVAYATPTHKSYDEVGQGLSTYYTSPSVLHKPVYADVSQYSTENHYHHASAPSHTLAYAPVSKEISYAAPVTKTLSYATPIAKSITYAPTVYESHEVGPIYGHTHESVQRSHDGTVSHYGKTISSPHSHVHKSDTRVTNDHYKVAAVPTTVTYQSSPILNKIETSPVYQQYAHSAPVVQKYVAPIVQKYAAAPVQHYSSAPVQHYSTAPVQHYSSAPVQHYSSAPVQHYSSAPVQHYSSAPVQHYAPSSVHQYAHAAPIVAQKTVSYSPAEAVAHASFESTNTHYSW